MLYYLITVNMGISDETIEDILLHSCDMIDAKSIRIKIEGY